MATVVQITDLHLHRDPDGRLLDVPTWQTFDEALELLDRAVPEWDWLVLTGDLAQDHERATYDALAERLGDRVKRTLVIPGNHDDPEHMRAVFPTGCGPVGARFAQEVGSWLLIGLDSHVSGEVPGAIDATQTAWAQERIDAHPDHSVVLFMHHPPVPVGAAWLDAMGLTDPAPVGALVERNAARVRAVVCGHVHQDTRGSLHGVPVFTTPSTAFQFERGGDEPALEALPPGFRVLELGKNALGTRVIRFDALRHPPVHPGPAGY